MELLKYSFKPISLCILFGRRSGLMVSELDSGLSDPGSSPGQGHCVVFYTMIGMSYIIQTNMTTIQHMFQTFQETRLTRPLNRILSPQFFLVKGDGRCTRTTHLCNLEITRDSSLNSTWFNYYYKY